MGVLTEIDRQFFLVADESYDFPVLAVRERINEPLRLHAVDHDAIHLVGKGGARLEKAGVIRPIVKGDLFIQGEGCSLSFHDVRGLEILSVVIHSKGFSTLAPSIPEWTGLPVLFKRLFASFREEGEGSIHLGIDAQLAIEGLIERMIKERNERLEGWMCITASLLSEIIVSVCRKRFHQPLMDTEASTQVANAIAYMEAHFSERISLTEIARHACISERHLFRLFKESNGISPYDYLLSIRMNHACELLTQGRLPIMDIAIRCGYEDSNHFSRQFQRHMGLSPSLYKEKQKELRKEVASKR